MTPPPEALPENSLSVHVEFRFHFQKNGFAGLRQYMEGFFLELAAREGHLSVSWMMAMGWP